MIAQYEHDFDCYAAHRNAQWQEMISFVEETSDQNHIVILTGDFNTPPDASSYKLYIEQGFSPLSDSTRHFDFFDIHAGRDIKEVATFAHPQNSWRRKNAPLEKLDYIIYDRKFLEPISEKLEFTEKNNGISMSDHFGISAIFKITDQESKESPKIDRPKQREQVKNIILVYRLYLSSLEKDKLIRKILTFASLLLYFILLFLSIYFRNEGYSIVFQVIQAPVIVFAVFNALLFTIFLNEEYAVIKSHTKQLELRLAHIDDLEKTQ